MSAHRHTFHAALCALAALGVFVSSAAARVDSDLSTPEKRKQSVELAVHTSKLVRLDALSLEMPNPFSPPQFSLTDA
ncbi:MAG: hypothetical protein OK454_09870, partial [Thaumarchaeota archaeon]|nr:hypothetical protein [Nitrososphaerota archaeon]